VDEDGLVMGGEFDDDDVGAGGGGGVVEMNCCLCWCWYGWWWFAGWMKQNSRITQTLYVGVYKAETVGKVDGVYDDGDYDDDVAVGVDVDGIEIE
jgi:hypothetical protein